MQPAPAIPPFEPPPLPVSLSDSGRRILWIVGLYRAVCAAMLMGTALLVDPKLLNVATPNAFITGVGLYFLFGLSSFWWVQQERLPLQSRFCCYTCSRPAKVTSTTQTTLQCRASQRPG